MRSSHDAMTGRLAGLPAAVVIATVGVLLLRLVLASRVPLVDDEAYYWLWAQHLAWGYPDHPPMIAALIALGTRLFGDGPLAIRIVPLLLASVIPPLVYLTGRDLFDRAAGRRAALLVLALPIFTLGPALTFPDSPLGLFWVLGLWSGWHALRDGGWWWVAAAASVALALLSKLTGGFLLVGIAAVWLAGPWRRAIRDPGWYAGLAGGLLLILPTLWWNAGHDWWVVRMIWDRAPWLVDRSVPENLLIFIGGQILYHGALWPALIAAAVAAVRRGADPAWRYLAWMSVPIVAATIPLAVVGQAKPHWASPGYVAAAIALAAVWPEWRRPRALLVAAVVLSGLMLTGVAGTALSPAGRQFQGTATGWPAATELIYREAEQRRAFILTSSYQSASQLLYHLPAPVPVTSPIGAFPIWQPPEELAGRSVLFVMDTAADPTPVLARMCRHVGRGGTVTTVAGRVLTLYHCTDFSGSFASYPVRGLP